MKEKSSDIDLIERYIHSAWVLKIRLMSSRCHLWDKQISLIHLENALLQLRKICEGISYMCVIAAEFEQDKQLRDLRNKHKVGAVLKTLQKRKMLEFPKRAKLIEKKKLGDQTVWELQSETGKQGDREKVIDIHRRCNKFLHETTPFNDWNTTHDEAKWALSNSFQHVQSDHQWLWNQFWEHSITLRNTIFYVNLANQTETSQPWIIKEEGLPVEKRNVNLDPDFIADFTGKIDWKRYASK